MLNPVLLFCPFQALGCVLFYLCFMEHPFEDSAKLRILNAKYTIPESDTKYTVFHDLISKYKWINCKKSWTSLHGPPWAIGQRKVVIVDRVAIFVGRWEKQVKHSMSKLFLQLTQVLMSQVVACISPRVIFITCSPKKFLKSRIDYSISVTEFPKKLH